MSPRPSGAPVIAIVISIAAVALAGPLLVGALWADHALDYHGTCGPHPTDIPEHPCPFDQYLVEFFSPFAMIALAMVACGGWIVGAVIVGAAWIAWAIVRAIRGSPREGGGRG